MCVRVCGWCKIVCIIRRSRETHVTFTKMGTLRHSIYIIIIYRDIIIIPRSLQKSIIFGKFVSTIYNIIFINQEDAINALYELSHFYEGTMVILYIIKNNYTYKEYFF